jgi:tripartite-type tricarboxylate transporter receptor subunit TctC
MITDGLAQKQYRRFKRPAREETMMRRYRRSAVTVMRLAAVALAVIAAGSAQAQTVYPERVIKMIVPSPAGGQTDVMARLMAQKMQQSLGQSVIIENRAGAGGALGARTAAAAEPDGYTLFYGNTSTLAVIPAVSKNAGYDPVKNYAPVASVSESYMILVVRFGCEARICLPKEFGTFLAGETLNWANIG